MLSKKNTVFDTVMLLALTVAIITARLTSLQIYHGRKIWIETRLGFPRGVFLLIFISLCFSPQCEGSTSGLEPSVAFGRLPYRSVSQEVVNEAGEGVARHVAPKPAPGRRVERKQSQEDSVISGGSLQDRDSDFDRPPPARYTKASLARSKYGRKFSDPQPMLPLSVGGVPNACY